MKGADVPQLRSGRPPLPPRQACPREGGEARLDRRDDRQRRQLLGLNRYDEFGQPQSTNLGAFGYTGQAWLPTISVWYYKARVLDPELGRFLQTDPIGYGDSPNLYAYVGNDPINFVDPFGFCRFTLWGNFTQEWNPATGEYDPPRLTSTFVTQDSYCASPGDGGGGKVGGGGGGSAAPKQPQPKPEKQVNCKSAARQIEKLASGATLGAATGAVTMGALGAGPAAAALGGAAAVTGLISLGASVYIYRTEGDLGILTRSAGGAALGIGHALSMKAFRIFGTVLPSKQQERVGQYLLELAPNAIAPKNLCP